PTTHGTQAVAIGISFEYLLRDGGVFGYEDVFPQCFRWICACQNILARWDIIPIGRVGASGLYTFFCTANLPIHTLAAEHLAIVVGYVPGDVVHELAFLGIIEGLFGEDQPRACRLHALFDLA